MTKQDIAATTFQDTIVIGIIAAPGALAALLCKTASANHIGAISIRSVTSLQS
jgi:hypothetical protein